jgi:hypothetical protein
VCAVIKQMIPIQRKNREKFYLSYKQSTCPVRTAVRVRGFERRTAGRKSVCIWKVLRPATSIKDFLSTADAQFHCMVLMQPSPELTSKFSPQCNPVNVMKTPSHCCFPNTSLTPNAPLLCSAAHCQQSNSQHAAFFTAQSCTSLPLLEGLADID